jgi:SNF2 family DNA or RNA helicase
VDMMIGLKTELKEFQKETVERMLKYEEKYDGGLLLNDAGLGKTICMLGVMNRYKLRTLIIVNSGLIENWINEIKKHTTVNLLDVVIYHGAKRHDYVELERHCIYITSYAIVAREFNKGVFDNNSILSKIQFGRIVLDEAHYIRNKNTVAHKSVIYLGDQHIGVKKWVITATPIFNVSKDAYAYFKFLNLEGIDTILDWSKLISRNVNGMHKLNEWIKKYSIAYKKENVLKELKSKDEKKIELKLSGEELNFYNALKEYSIIRIKKIVNKIKKVDTDEMNRHLRSCILVFILRLKQTCNSPWLVIRSMKKLIGVDNIKDAVTKLDFYNRSLKDETDNECPICYDNVVNCIIDPCGHKFCKDCLDKLEVMAKFNCSMCNTYIENVNNIKGDIEIEKNAINKDVLSELQETAKIKYIIELTKKVINKDEKIVIVSQWVSMLDIIAKVFDNVKELKKIKSVCLKGNVSLKERFEYIKKFQEDKDVKVCFISLMSSAEGINLTAGNHMVLIDSWWNKSKMIQVSNRIHRILQTKQVYIYNLQISDSIEKNIEKLVNKKFKLSNLILNKWEIEDKDNYDDSWISSVIKLIE